MAKKVKKQKIEEQEIIINVPQEEITEVPKIKEVSIDEFKVDNIVLEQKPVLPEPKKEINIASLSKLDQRMYAKTGIVTKTKENYYDRFKEEK